MNKHIFKIFILLIFLTNNTMAKENIMILKLKDGNVNKFTTKTTIKALKNKIR